MKQSRALLIFWLSLVFFSLNSCTAQDSTRDNSIQPNRVMDSLGIREGMIIGEAGAGEGYFTFKLSKRVGEKGIIYANDISEKALNVIKDKCKNENITNIKTVIGEIEDPLFPVETLDMIIMVYAFHDFDKKVEWLENAKKYLKSDATLVMIELDPEKAKREYDHFMLKEKLIEKVGEANYQLVYLFTFPKDENVYVFKPRN